MVLQASDRAQSVSWQPAYSLMIGAIVTAYQQNQDCIQNSGVQGTRGFIELIDSI